MSDFKLGQADGASRTLRIFQNLFDSGPNTRCRTVWRDDDPSAIDRTECVEIPMEDVRYALDRAEKLIK